MTRSGPVRQRQPMARTTGATWPWNFADGSSPMTCPEVLASVSNREQPQPEEAQRSRDLVRSRRSERLLGGQGRYRTADLPIFSRSPKVRTGPACYVTCRSGRRPSPAVRARPGRLLSPLLSFTSAAGASPASSSRTRSRPDASCGSPRQDQAEKISRRHPSFLPSVRLPALTGGPRRRPNPALPSHATV